MKLINVNPAITQTYGSVPPTVEQWLKRWVITARAATWWSEQHVMASYPAVACTPNGRADFSCGQSYHLGTDIDYALGHVDVEGVYDPAGKRI